MTEGLGSWDEWPPVLVRLPLAVSAPLLTALFVGPLLMVALAVQGATLLLWLALVADLVLLFVFAVATHRRPVLFVGLLTVWFVVQRLVLALAAPHISVDTLRLLFTYKEGFYIVLLVAASVGIIVRHSQGQRSFFPLFLADVLALTLLALLTVNFFFSSADFSPKLTYARRLAAPLLLYLGGRLLLPDRRQLLESLRFLVLAALAVAFFGLVERFLLDASFWRHQVDALGLYQSLADGGLLPAAWISPFQEVPEGIFVAFPVDVPVRRMVSTYLEPTTLGAFLALALLLQMFMLRPKGDRMPVTHTVSIAVLTAAIAATVSRGAMEIALIGGGLAILLSGGWALRQARRLEAGVMAAAAVLLVAALLVSSLSFAQFPHRRSDLQSLLSARVVSGLDPLPASPPASGEALNVGAQTHVNGLTSGLKQMLKDPGGMGLGAAGVWSRAPEAGSESTVGTVAAQLGAPGLALWLAFHMAVIAGLIRAGLRLQRHGEGLWASGVLTLGAAFIGLFATAWFSESASGLLGNAFFFLYAGWALTTISPTVPGLRLRWLPGVRDD